MAIKPNDCVVKIQDLVIGTKKVPDGWGGKVNVPEYQKFWENFTQHVDAIVKKKKLWNAHIAILEEELSKYNATYKETKNWDSRYVKFETHSDYTFFVLSWS